MLTVKHLLHGQEHIYQAPYGVTYTGPLANVGAGGPNLGIPQTEPKDGFGTMTKALYGGFAYVMNDAGATVGSYELGDAPEDNAALKAA